MTAKSGVPGAPVDSSSKAEVALSMAKLAKILGVTDKTVRDWATRRGLPHYKTPSQRLEFVPSEVKIYLEENGMRVPESLL